MSETRSPTILPDVASLAEHIGTDLGVSGWTEIAQERIADFARATGDHQWIHTDVERARRESPFGETVAHGYLTVALCSALLPELLVVEKCSRVVNYGIDKLRLREPVRAGSRIRIGGTIKGVRNIANGGARVTLSVRWEVEGARRPVCLADVVLVYFAD
jgi:acyl dehydratase